MYLQKHPFKKDFTPLCGGGSIIVKHWIAFCYSSTTQAWQFAETVAKALSSTDKSL